MRIVQIGLFPTDVNCIKGGVEASVYGLSKALTMAGHQVFVFDLPRHATVADKEENLAGISVFRYKNTARNFFSFSRISGYLSGIKLINPASCHIHSSSLFCFLLYLLLRLKKQKCVVTIHGLAYIEKRNRWRQKKSVSNFMRYVYQSAIEFLFLSSCPEIIVDTAYVDHEIQNWKRSGKILRMPVCHVIPQGVDARFYSTNRHPVRNQLLAVGAFTKRKGHLLLIKAMRDVVNAIPEAKLTITGVSNQPSYLESLRQEIVSLNLTSSVTLIPNASQDTIIQLYENAAIFALHSEEESQGIVLCEALATGLPIVSTSVGGIPYVVKHSKNGLLCEYGDYQTFASHIVYLLENDSIRDSISSENRKESGLYDWTKIAGKILKFY